MSEDKSASIPLRHRCEAALAKTVLGFLNCLPLRPVSDFGGWLGRTGGPNSSAHGVAERNLARALPALDDAARRQALRNMWDNFGRTMTEYAALARLWRGAWREHIEVVGIERLKAVAGKPAILFSGHLGNWELIPLATAALGEPLCIVYRAANNPLVDEMIARIRGLYVAGFAPKGSEGAREVLDHLKGGGKVFMIVDQKMNTGLDVPFFGRGAMTGGGIARLAARFDCPVFPVRCERTDKFRFRVTVEEPWSFSGDDERTALARVNGHLEQWIRERPGQWLWMHKRWPD